MNDRSEQVTEMTEQIRRITAMEKLLNEAENAIAGLDRALQAYADVQENIRTLQDYYEGGLWMQDFEDDRAGKIPSNIPRGVLSEDAIYDLLTDQFRLGEMFRELGGTEQAEHD